MLRWRINHHDIDLVLTSTEAHRDGLTLSQADVIAELILQDGSRIRQINERSFVGLQFDQFSLQHDTD